MRPSIPKRLGKAQNRKAGLMDIQFQKKVKDALKSSRLDIIRRPTKEILRIDDLLKRLEAGQIIEEELTKETGLSYYEAVGAWYRYVVAYEHSWLRTMVPFLLSKEEYNAIVGGRELP